MKTDIVNCIEELQKRLDCFKEQEPTEEELRKFSEDFLLVRRALDQLDRDLKKNYDDYSIVYADWAYRREMEQQSRMDEWVKRNQLEIAF